MQRISWLNFNKFQRTIIIIKAKFTTGVIHVIKFIIEMKSFNSAVIYLYPKVPASINDIEKIPTVLERKTEHLRWSSM